MNETLEQRISRQVRNEFFLERAANAEMRNSLNPDTARRAMLRYNELLDLARYGRTWGTK